MLHPAPCATFKQVVRDFIQDHHHEGDGNPYFPGAQRLLYPTRKTPLSSGSEEARRSETVRYLTNRSFGRNLRVQRKLICLLRHPAHQRVLSWVARTAAIRIPLSILSAPCRLATIQWPVIKWKQISSNRTTCRQWEPTMQTVGCVRCLWVLLQYYWTTTY